MVTGFVISIVFQLAHTVEHTEFPMPNEATNKIENEWAIHQVATTANFSTGNKLISWLVGGLNFQIEHHLFPKISHIHYPAISKIIKAHLQRFWNYLYRISKNEPGYSFSRCIFKATGKGKLKKIKISCLSF